MTGGPIRLVSWNVFNRNPDGERIARLADTLKPGLLALQEVVAAHQPALDRIGGHRATALDYLDGQQETLLATVSRTPFLSVERFDGNPGRRLSGSWYGRRMRWAECLQALAVTVDLHGGPLTLVNLHLSAAVAPSAREAELRAILDWLGERRPAVLCGDFNSFGRAERSLLAALPLSYRLRDLLSDENRALRRLMARAGFEAAPLTAPTFRRFGVGIRMDHIFARGVAIRELAVIADRHGSDHHGLTCLL